MGIKLDSNLSTRDRAIALNNADAICSWLGGKAPATVREIKEKRGPYHKNVTEASEHQHQVAVINWWGNQCNFYNLPRFALFSIPNANMLLGKANNPALVMNYLKSEGFRKGAPDLMLAVPTEKHPGMFIELKRNEKAVIRPEQCEFQAYLCRIGYKAVICTSSEHAINSIKSYLQDFKQVI